MQEQLWEHFRNIVFVNQGIYNFANFGKMVYRTFWDLVILSCGFPKCALLGIWKLDIWKLKVIVPIIENVFFVKNCGYLRFYQMLWRWGPENDETLLNKISRIMDMNFISIQNMKWKFGNFFIFNEAHRAPWECQWSTKGPPGVSIKHIGPLSSVSPSTPQHSDSHPCTRPNIPQHSCTPQHSDSHPNCKLDVKWWRS